MAEAWTYGKQGTRFPVAEEQVWKVGSHTFVCSDLMTSSLYFDVLADSPPTLVYCDPPWGNSLLNGFRTKAGKPKATYDWTLLYRRIAALATQYAVDCWLEGSKPSSRDGSQILPTMLNVHTAQWEITYGSANHPAGLYFSGAVPYPPSLTDALTGVNDIDTPRLVMQAYPPGGTVADPCSGRGNTSRQAHAAGWSSVLNEMNVNRMSAALARAEDAGLGEAVRCA